MTLHLRAPTPEDLISAKDTTRRSDIHCSNRNHIPVMDSNHNSGQGESSHEYQRTSMRQSSPESVENGNWGFQFDMEAMARDEPRRNPYKADGRHSKNHDNFESSSDGSWSNNTDRDQSWTYDRAQQDHDRNREPRSDRDQRYTSSQESVNSNVWRKEQAEDTHASATEDIWGLSEREQMAAPVPGRSPNGDNMPDINNELTRYWANSNVINILRPNPDGLAFLDDQSMHIYDRGDWGSAPQPVMDYNGESYVSDVLIEQQTRQFWSKRNGEWILLNQSTISHQQNRRVVEWSTQGITGERYLDDDSGEDSAIDDNYSNDDYPVETEEQAVQEDEATVKGQDAIDTDEAPSSGIATRTSSDNGPSQAIEFYPEHYDFDKAGFVEEEEWRKPSKDRKSKSVDDIRKNSDSWSTDNDGLDQPTRQESLLLEPATLPKVLPDFSTAKSMVLSTTYPKTLTHCQQPSSRSEPWDEAERMQADPAFGMVSPPEISGRIDLLNDTPISETRLDRLDPSTSEINLSSGDQSQAKVIDVGLLVDLGIDDNLPSANNIVTPTSPKPVQPSQIPPTDVQEADSSSLSSQAIMDSTDTTVTPMLMSTEATAILASPKVDLLNELGSPHDWLNQLASRNQEHFEKSWADNRQQWNELMAKQTEDSKKIHDFIERTLDKGSETTTADTKSSRGKTPFSLLVQIETKGFGKQDMRVTEKDDLKELVQDFCEKYDMHAYEMALWVTVASAIKEKKKKLRGKRTTEL
ncbi:hypothetical protein BGZ51_000935 [Haplosporangium sp. Z 767]|nr:hypothetical protein BGZ51_000935 [Haplosporangium sp. Z 767]KAF9192628.1 hypothetical protein BGZ50_008333 [Haplosporangium sp. Z 11]